MHRGSIRSQIVSTSAYKNVCVFYFILSASSYLNNFFFEKDVIKLALMDLRVKQRKTQCT